jgi:hypothetical protein
LTLSRQRPFEHCDTPILYTFSPLEQDASKTINAANKKRQERGIRFRLSIILAGFRLISFIIVNKVGFHFLPSQSTEEKPTAFRGKDNNLFTESHHQDFKIADFDSFLYQKVKNLYFIGV